MADTGRRTWSLKHGLGWLLGKKWSKSTNWSKHFAKTCHVPDFFSGINPLKQNLEPSSSNRSFQGVLLWPENSEILWIIFLYSYSICFFHPSFKHAIARSSLSRVTPQLSQVASESSRVSLALGTHFLSQGKQRKAAEVLFCGTQVVDLDLNMLGQRCSLYIITSLLSVCYYQCSLLTTKISIEQREITSP